MAQRLTPLSTAGSSFVLDSARWTEHAYTQGNNLPTPPTPLIGREHERTQAVSILANSSTRLLTLYGMGGVGKTRLSLAIGTDLLDHFPDGVFFIPLQNITEGGLLPSAISQALELYTLPGDSALDALISHMRDMNALLILDNFEQLISAAPMLSTILSACPLLKLLVTSRFVLNLRGEQELPLQPLPLPDPGHKPGDIASIENSSAVRLFVQRAASVKPNFTLDAGNANAVAAICARLDGLPLAIELAASRIKFFSPAAIVTRLQKRMQLLTDGAKDLPVRQQTLRNVITWSYDLLTPNEQRLFRLLSVFSGCTLDAAQNVCDTLARNPDPALASAYSDLNLLDLVTSLATKSLIRVVGNEDDEARIVMLETVHEYAAEQLNASPEAGPARTAQALYVMSVAAEAEPGMKSQDQVLWLNRLEKEIGNIRLALEWSSQKEVDGTTDPERLRVGLTIAGALGRFWNARGHLRESSDWFKQLFAMPYPKRDINYARALRSAGSIEFLLGNLDLSQAYYEIAMEVARELNNDTLLALALVGIGNVLRERSLTDRALELYKECLEIWTRAGSGYTLGVASINNNIGVVLLESDPGAALPYMERAVQLYREQGDVEYIGMTLDSLGQVYLKLGDLENAEKCFLEALSIHVRLGDQWNTSYNLVSWGRYAFARNDFTLSVRSMAAANALSDNLPTRLEKSDLAIYTTCLQVSRATLGDNLFNNAWADGMRMTPADMFGIFVANSAFPQQPRPIQAPAPKVSSLADVGLSTRETEVLVLLAQGFSNGEIAEKLFLSLYTVNAHLRTIYKKLDVTSRTAATRFALETGLL